MRGPGWCPGGLRACLSLAALPGASPARVRRGICLKGAARSISCLPLSFSRWRSICWRVTFPTSRRRGQDQAGRNMRGSTDFSRFTATRRGVLTALGGAAILGAVPGLARAQSEPGEAAVLRDSDNPVFGNPEGDISIVEWFDFNCPYCRKIEPELRQVVQDDGKIRLVMKDWPILGPVSVTASRMALACKYQGKYDKGHDALIGVSCR